MAHKDREYCNESNPGAELRLVEVQGERLLVAKCPCCGDDTYFDLPCDAVKVTVLKTGSQIVGRGCSRCGWTWCYFEKPQVQILLETSRMKLLALDLGQEEGFKIVTRTVTVQSSP